MNLVDRVIPVRSRSDSIEIWPIGDTHIGKCNCKEDSIRRLVAKIQQRPNAYWVGGGDMIDCIKPSDIKRFNFRGLADWFYEGTPGTIKEALGDILSQQTKRMLQIFRPIAGKCLGLIEGNHEYEILQRHNEDVHGRICHALKAENLTEAAWMRLRFKRGQSMRVVSMVIQHGAQSGRAEASERRHLAVFRSEWGRADIVLQGNSHTFSIAEPKPELYAPIGGALPKELYECHRWAANWGCWLKSHKRGPSPYEERKGYPSRAGYTICVTIRPFAAAGDNPEIDIRKEKI